MSRDARFEEAEAGPLALLAQTPEDLTVLSALIQDAVVRGADIAYRPRQRQVALLLSRFRWEDAEEARRAGRGFERVRAVLLVRDVVKLRSQGIDRGDGGAVHALLSLTFDPDAAAGPGGRLRLTFAGGGVIEAHLEALDLALRDVTRPHYATSGKAPDHSAG